MTLVIIGACGMPHGPDIADSVRTTGWGFWLHWPGPCRSEVTKSDFVVFGDVLGGKRFLMRPGGCIHLSIIHQTFAEWVPQVAFRQRVRQPLSAQIRVRAGG